MTSKVLTRRDLCELIIEALDASSVEATDGDRDIIMRCCNSEVVVLALKLSLTSPGFSDLWIIYRKLI